MKKWLIGVAAVIVVLVVVLLVLPLAIPVENFKGRIADEVKAATGRDFAINGPISLSLLPSVALEVNDVSFGNAPGASDKTMARLTKLQLKVDPLALLRKELVIDSFVLIDPKIALEIDKQGRPNWQFATAAKPAPPPASGSAPSAATPPKPAATPQPAAPPPAGGAAGALEGAHLGDVRLVNGTVSYSDARTGKTQLLEKINAKLSLPSLDNPMRFSGNATWNSKTVELTFGLDKPRLFLAGEKSPVSFTLAAPATKFDFQGEVASAKELTLDGATSLDIASLRDLASWTGATLPATSGGLQSLKIDGKLALAGPKMQFNGAQLALDQIKAKGDLLVDSGGAKPYIKAGLEVDKLDLNPYLPPPGGKGEAAKTAPAKPGAAPAAAPAAPSAPAPSASAAAPAAASGWSDEPIDMSGLTLANADLALTVGGIAFKKITIGSSALTVELKDGKLAADLSKMQLYDGGGTAKINLDGAAAPPALQANVNLAKVQAQPLLRDVMDFDKVSGNANGDVAVNAHGKSERELIASLGGKGAVQFLNGAVKGINLGAIFKNPVGGLLDANSQKSEQTEFSQATGTFTIANGVLENKDLDLKSPLFDVTGAGTVNLLQRTISYKLTPPSAIPVEVQVEGPWDHISYRPQPNPALLKQPGKALEGLQTLIPGAQGGGAAQGGGTAPASPSPGNLLKGLFGTKP